MTERVAIEDMVLHCLSTQQAIPLSEVCQRLPHLKGSSVSVALLHLLADRSVRRVKRGVYCLTELGRARLEGGLTP